MVTRKTKVWIKGWTFSPTPNPRERPGLETELITNGQWLNLSYLHNGTPIKNPKQHSLDSFWVVRCIQGDKRVTCLKLSRDRSSKSCVHSASGPYPICLFIRLLMYILHKQLVVVSKVFPWVLWAKPKKGLGEPLNYSWWVRSIWMPSSCDWHLKSVQSWGAQPLTWGESVLTPGSYCQSWIQL